MTKQKLYCYGSAALSSVEQLDAARVLQTFKESMLSLAKKSGEFTGLRKDDIYYSLWDIHTTPISVITKAYAASTSEEFVFARNCVVIVVDHKSSNDVNVVINWKMFLNNIIQEMLALPILGLCIHFMRDFLSSQYVSLVDKLSYILKHEVSSIIGGKPMPLDIEQEHLFLPYAYEWVTGACKHSSRNPAFVYSLKNIFDKLVSTNIKNTNEVFSLVEIPWGINCSVINITALKVNPNIGTLYFTNGISPPKFRCRYTSMFSELYTLSRYGGDPTKPPQKLLLESLDSICGIRFKVTLMNNKPRRIMVLDLLKLLPIRVACSYAPYGKLAQNVIMPFTEKLKNYHGEALKLKHRFMQGKIPQAITGADYYSLLNEEPDGGKNSLVVFVDLDALESSYSKSYVIDSKVIFSIPWKENCRSAGKGRPVTTLDKRTFSKRYSGTVTNLSIEFIFGQTGMLYRLKTFDVRHLLTPEGLVDLTAMSVDVATAKFRGFAWKMPLRTAVISGNIYLNKPGLCALLENACVHDSIPEWSPAWLKDFLNWIDDNTVKTRIEFKQLLKHVREEETQRAKSAEVNRYFIKELLNLVLNTFRGQRKKIYDVSSVHRDALLKIPQDILEYKTAELRENLLERGEYNLNHLPHICLTPDIKQQVDVSLMKAQEEGRINDEEYLHIKALNDKKRVYKQYKLSTKQVKNAIESINNNG